MQYDVIIVGAGAAGMMCASEAGKCGRKVWLVDHAKKPAGKIRISGGGRCNFTNINANPHAFISKNPHFCKSALARYSAQDFIDMVERYNIAYHEKKLGQLFCDNSAQDIISMLIQECIEVDVKMDMQTSVTNIDVKDGHYILQTTHGVAECRSLVIATGGLSIPKMGATSYGYQIAKQFGHSIISTNAGLVPLTFQNELLEMCSKLTGLSVEAEISNHRISFAEGMLFTHRGLSGPSILQLSSYWEKGEEVTVNLAPEVDVLSLLKEKKLTAPKQDIQTILSEIIPKRLAAKICENYSFNGRLADFSNLKLEEISCCINSWIIRPSGTEGYRTAEVTLGGVNTNELSSKTMESKLSKGLFFIGEVVDVTGWLGGYNFQWAWSSGYVAGQSV